MRVALAQMTSGPVIAENLRWMVAAIERAAGEGAQLIVFPEYAPHLCPDVERVAAAEALDGPQMTTLRAAAQRHGLAVGVGSFAEQGDTPGRSKNTSVVLGSDGSVLATYAKAHLFDVNLGAGESYRESDTVEPGPLHPVVVDLHGWKVGLSICYDVRFPEHYRALSAMGAEVLLVPAAFTVPTGAAHWELLLRARAVENQAWVVAAAQTGVVYGSRRTWGHSMVVSPWGTVVTQMEAEPGVRLVDLDREAMASVRARIPALRHRRAP